MTRTFTWAVGSAVIALGLLTGQGCLVKLNNGDTGGGSSTTTGSDTTSGNNTTVSVGATVSVGVTTASGVLPSSCDAKAGDDTCTACEKKSCCAELEACSGDEACAATYGAYSECLFPGGVDASGYTTTYCQNLAGKQSPAGKAPADAIITCLTTTCGTDTACGTPEKVTWDNFANEFTENFCNGCHFPGFGGWNAKGEFKEVPQDIPQFTDDAEWQSIWAVPKGNPDWATETRFDLVSAKIVADKTWCGVSTTLPDFCATDFPGHFPTAQRFPPKGADLNSTSAPSCQWTADGSCPQPTVVERNKLASWVFDGTPQN
jgi:hypothetical protein